MRDIAFEDLKKIISEKTRPVVFWTGAGVSAPSMPSWKGLLNELIKVAISKAATIVDNKALLSTIEFVKTEKDLWVSFERLYSIDNGIGHESFRSTITKILMPSNSCEIPRVHSLLWSLKPKGIVTLNLDFFTQRSSTAYSKENITPIYILPKNFGQNASVFKEARPFIAYPHGYADNVDSWTFTSSTLSARLNDPQYVSWVSTLFASHTVVFVGLTADDVAVGGLLDRISKVNSISFRDNFGLQTEMIPIQMDGLKAEESGSLDMKLKMAIIPI